MSEAACHYALIEAPREHHEAILERAVTPLAGRFRDADPLESLFFVRYSEPTWQLRFRILGEPAWIDDVARAEVRAALSPLLGEGVATAVREATYDREFERYGGPRGMRLAERVFHVDSLAALDWMALERAGRTQWQRREFSLLLSERIADLFGFDGDARRPFYREGYRWAFDTGLWDEGARATLDERARSSRAGLAALLDPPEPATGTGEERAVLREFRDALRPTGEALRAGLADGSIRAHAPHLAWSLAHMSTNRLGIDPAAEAILRYLAGHRASG
jgi:thiopeptide-type bacteriocin biosynthesis protein